ncbi:MAG: prepilin-type N-terminal cleavage/methylation domain-containing protein [Planctomycetota bacterium]|nr:MAG: prepilin-type N-terminal cleavage/methylation domain-containing protein [Planctomycetota bacterium]
MQVVVLEQSKHSLRQRAIARPHRRPGFTLFELMIVLAVLAIIAGMSWPRMMRYIEENQLKDNTETVRRELAATRMLAIDSGLTYQFRYEPGKRAFIILPHDRPESPSDEKAPEDRPKVKTVSGELAEDCSFAPATDITGGERLDDLWLSLLSNGAQYSETVWSAPILFRPNGEGQTRHLTVRDTTGRSITLHVRGLTGGVTVNKLRPAEAQP